jgi:hypothetical protein
MPGDLATQLAARDRSCYFQALERAVNGYTDATGAAIPRSLQILSTPAVFLIDATNDQVKTLRLAGGSLGVADTCLAAYSSDNFVAPTANPAFTHF